MENFRLLTTVTLIVVVLATPQTSLAYKVNTHSQLTEQTLAIYNSLYGPTFSQSDIKSASEGSIGEDDNPRYINHFYDPVNKVGLMGGRFMSAREWSQNTIAQSEEGINLWDSDKLYSDNTDYSWDRAVYEYAHGSRARAMESLGHILHLIQDTTVPAHVRDDDHLSVFSVGDINLYEEYTTKIQPSVHVAKWQSFKTFDELYVHSASFTNKNFLSKDTVFTDYTLPKRENLQLIRSPENGARVFIGVSKNGYLVLIKKFIDYNLPGAPEREEWQLNDKKDLILANYYKILANKAGEYGISTINTFFAAVADEQKTERLRYMNRSRDEVRALVEMIDDANSISFFSSTKAARQELEELTIKELAGYKAVAEVYGVELPEVKYTKDEDKDPTQVKGQQPKPANQGAPDKQAEDGSREQEASPQEPKPRQKIKIPEAAVTPTFDYVEMQKLLSQLQKMLEGYLAQLPPDKCADIDLAIIKYSTCLSPFEEGGYGYGGGGSATAVVVCYAPSNDPESPCYDPGPGGPGGGGPN